MLQPYNCDDLERLAAAVRRFLDKGDFDRSMTRAAVVFEFTDISHMRKCHNDVLAAMPPSAVAAVRQLAQARASCTVEIDVGSVCVILTCPQRIETPQGPKGYNELEFR